MSSIYRILIYQQLLPILLSLSLLINLLISTSIVQANTFIWDPNNADNIELVRPTFSRHSTFTNPSKCIKIPANLTLCYGIRYSEMRLPNLLYHETMNEVIEQSNFWIQLTKIGCHPDTQLFLCSLFSPVCLDQTIPPCRSLCENVKHNCEPSMLNAGYSWPPMMQCNLFPIENNMCIESQVTNSMDNIHSGQNETSLATIITNNKIDDNNNNNNNTEIHFQQTLLDAICNSDWVIKMGFNQIRNSSHVRVKKYKIIFGNLNLPAPFTLMINKSMIITDYQQYQQQQDRLQPVHDSINGRSINNNNNNNNNNIKNREKFIIIGKGNQKENVRARLAVSWMKNTVQIKKAIRKAKSNVGCKNYLIKSSMLTTNNDNNSNKINGTKRARNRNRKKNPNLTRIQ